MSVASKNLFALLGNDDGDEQPSAPVKTVDKTTMRSTKRNVEPQAPTKPAANTGARRTAGPGGNEGAFRDRNAGRDSNKSRGTMEASRDAPRGGRGARERGGRGGRFPRDRDDRHAKGIASGSEKQAAHGWGAEDGGAEQKDEQAGEEIAKTELNQAAAEDVEDANATPAEPEEKQVSFEDYLAQQAEKKAALGENLEIRKPNEGSKLDKKWANAKPLTKEEDDEFIAGSSGKAKRERERKTKQLVDIDQRYVEPERTRGGARGGRGGAAGRGAPRGDARGGRGGERGRGRGGDFRGGRPGGRENAHLKIQDESMFPSLGA
ncbi:hypothetical protein F4780DRAFT_775564 [Xylariomycetidae sp. FL0641]|nr:hypothetical protein F4780DRAFT_775564 [Xylariomycetidae sp. FL0641]